MSEVPTWCQDNDLPELEERLTGRAEECGEEMASRPPLVGIDLGTAHSVVAVYRKNGIVEVIPNDIGKPTTPSVVAILESERLVGEAAVVQSVMNQHATVKNVKKILGRSCCSIKGDGFPPLGLGVEVIESPRNRQRPMLKLKTEDPPSECTVHPEEVAALLLSSLKAAAEQFLGSSVPEAAVAVPAYFNAAQREAVEQSCLIAGFQRVQLVNDTSAAALSYAVDRGGSRLVVVIDIGAGGGAVSIVETSLRGLVKVLATSSERIPGGYDLDASVVASFTKEILSPKEVSCLDARASEILFSTWTKEKAKLSRLPHVTFQAYLPGIDIDFKRVFKREDLEQELEPMLEAIKSSLKEVLNASGKSVEEVNEVVLVGGTSRIPRLRTVVTEFFGDRKLCKAVNPDEGVACGAARYAASLSDDKDVASVLDDVIPLGLRLVHKEIKEVVFKPNTRSSTQQGTWKLAPGVFVRPRQRQLEVEVQQGAGENWQSIAHLTLDSGWWFQTKLVCNISRSGTISFKDAKNTRNLLKLYFFTCISDSDVSNAKSNLERFKKLDVEKNCSVEWKNRLEDLCHELRSCLVVVTQEATKDFINTLVDSVMGWLPHNPSAPVKEYQDRIKSIVHVMCEEIKDLPTSPQWQSFMEKLKNTSKEIGQGEGETQRPGTGAKQEDGLQHRSSGDQGASDTPPIKQSIVPHTTRCTTKQSSSSTPDPESLSRQRSMSRAPSSGPAGQRSITPQPASHHAAQRSDSSSQPSRAPNSQPAQSSSQVAGSSQATAGSSGLPRVHRAHCDTGSQGQVSSCSASRAEWVPSPRASDEVKATVTPQREKEEGSIRGDGAPGLAGKQCTHTPPPAPASCPLSKGSPSEVFARRVVQGIHESVSSNDKFWMSFITNGLATDDLALGQRLAGQEATVLRMLGSQALQTTMQELRKAPFFCVLLDTISTEDGDLVSVVLRFCPRWGNDLVVERLLALQAVEGLTAESLAAHLTKLWQEHHIVWRSKLVALSMDRSYSTLELFASLLSILQKDCGRDLRMVWNLAHGLGDGIAVDLQRCEWTRNFVLETDCLRCLRDLLKEWRRNFVLETDCLRDLLKDNKNRLSLRRCFGDDVDNILFAPFENRVVFNNNHFSSVCEFLNELQGTSSGSAAVAQWLLKAFCEPRNQVILRTLSEVFMCVDAARCGELSETVCRLIDMLQHRITIRNEQCYPTVMEICFPAPEASPVSNAFILLELDVLLLSKMSVEAQLLSCLDILQDFDLMKRAGLLGPEAAAELSPATGSPRPGLSSWVPGLKGRDVSIDLQWRQLIGGARLTEPNCFLLLRGREALLTLPLSPDSGSCVAALRRHLQRRASYPELEASMLLLCAKEQDVVSESFDYLKVVQHFMTNTSL